MQLSFLLLVVTEICLLLGMLSTHNSNVRFVGMCCVPVLLVLHWRLKPARGSPTDKFLSRIGVLAECALAGAGLALLCWLVCGLVAHVWVHAAWFVVVGSSGFVCWGLIFPKPARICAEVVISILSVLMIPFG